MLLRCLMTLKNIHLFTFEMIANLLGLNNRQDSNNFWREFQACEYDFGNFLLRKKKLREAFPLIEQQVLSAPLLDLREHYRHFCHNYPKFKMSYICFVDYCRNIDTVKFQKQVKGMLVKGQSQVDAIQLVSEVLAECNTNGLKRKEIVDIFPEVEKDDKEDKIRSSFLKDVDSYGKYILTMFLVACGLNYSVLSMLFGLSKGTISNYFHKLSFMKGTLLHSVNRWSGEISVDEKWIKINGGKNYILSIVDNVTNFPLYFDLVSDLKAETWKLFFQRFYHLYGTPELIVSDGSKSLAKGRLAVFPTVKSQLCKFHKFKNLLHRIYNMRDGKKKDRCFKLANGIFRNTTYYGRKRAAKTLAEMGVPGVSEYVKNNILHDWKNLTMCLTSNASERWNRKISKAIAKRYGLKSEKFVKQLITSLWLKEAINNPIHFEKCFIEDIDLPRICQENLKVCNIIDIIRRKLLQGVA